MIIAKQDIFKTILIIWFVATTGYFIFDQYNNYKIKGIQQAYQTGYGAAVDDVIKKAKDSNCNSFDVTKGDDKVSVINAECMMQQIQSTVENTQEKK